MKTMAKSAPEPAAGSIAILGLGQVRPDPEPAQMEMPLALGLKSQAAHLCPGPLGKGIIPPMTLRRLGRAQKLALVAARQALQEFPVSRDDAAATAVCVGTGLGELGETAVFLENLVRLEEREPRPTCFANSVHNSLASQIAIMFGFQGENHTVTHGPVSFELALWQALALLKTGRARYALVCGVDGLQGYSAFAGCEFGFWGNAKPPLPGEGAAAFLLGLDNPGRFPSAAPRLRMVRVLPMGHHGIDGIAGEDAIAFIESAIAPTAVTLGEMDLVLLGANGPEQLDQVYRGVRRALSQAAGKAICYGVYKHLCGEFCTAPALGLALAAEVLRVGEISPEILTMGGEPPQAPRNILLYHLSRPGLHSVCLVSR